MEGQVGKYLFLLLDDLPTICAFHSADFAQYILKQSPNSPSSLLDRTRLADAHILELG